MNRLEFFHYVRNSLVDTVKYAATPMIENDIKKLDCLVDKLTGVKWVRSPVEVPIVGCRTIYIQGRSVALFKKNGRNVSIDLRCQSCSSLIHWLEHVEELKCFHCDTSYNINEGCGELTLQELPNQYEDGQLYIGLVEGE
ncbi:hypothetical protein [Bacillus solimangrovi]|uniref:Rieske domain-containing protein n=1 Tax=Bacillus solimangrovi TaxID=1305675 RepID=A0A1E5LFH3_9BACI|nr:hypothetical protein [Bacillus solimangrovi]OEH92813.1 hypothetical protein BFG57_02125 [Bacillus solimangrovi]